MFGKRLMSSVVLVVLALFLLLTGGRNSCSGNADTVFNCIPGTDKGLWGY